MIVEAVAHTADAAPATAATSATVADDVVAVDADVNDNVINVIQRCRPVTETSMLYRTPAGARTSPFENVRVKHKGALIDALVAALLEGKRVFFTTNSKKMARHVERVCTQLLGEGMAHSFTPSLAATRTARSPHLMLRSSRDAHERLQ